MWYYTILYYTCFGHVSIFVISVQPICLPAPNQEFDGAEAIAMGWGAFEYKRGTGSKILKYVRLKVTHNRLRARAMFGTEISGTHLTNPSVKDACAGDSGAIITLPILCAHSSFVFQVAH